MKNKILSIVASNVLIFIGLLFFIEVLLRILGYNVGYKYYMKVLPTNVFKMDSVLGWRLNQGNYVFSVYNKSNTFKATIDHEGNRISSYPGKKGIKSKTLPSIHVYGCSYTFGFSVSDTSTACYKLQKMLPNYKVVNKGVPGYGLTQMYLLLKESLVKKDTPTIAIFNYGQFQDERTALNKNCSSLLVDAITNGYSKNFKNMKYPYMEFKKDSLLLSYCHIDDLPKFWPLHNKSVIVGLLNDMVFDNYDQKNSKYLHLISQKTALDIMKYCEANHIVPVFATVTPESTDILVFLNKNGYYTINYGIKIDNENVRSTIYNCGDADPLHPSGLTHTIYADKIVSLLKTINLSR